MKIAVVSANLGNFDKHYEHIRQSIVCDFIHITDHDFPPRLRSMTPRLQARIVKMFMWDFAPGYDIYLWVDSSCILSHPDSVKWFVDKLWNNKNLTYPYDIAVFKHPHRKTIKEEADYLKERLKMPCPYITPRYENELIDEQLMAFDDEYTDNKLYASTAFIYHINPEVKRVMKEWWFHTSRYHSIDQLSFPYVLTVSALNVNEIEENYLKIPYLEYVRKRK